MTLASDVVMVPEFSL